MGKVMVPKGFDPKFERHWYLVANRSDAVIYEGKLDGSFHFVRRLKNEAAENVKPGLFPDAEDVEKFARRLAVELDHAALEREYTDLVLVAEPHFLGLLHRHLSKNVQGVLAREVNREWSRGSDHELEEFLRAKLA